MASWGVHKFISELSHLILSYLDLDWILDPVLDIMLKLLQGSRICDWISLWQPWERCEEVGKEHMAFFGILVRFMPGSNFPTGSVVDTELFWMTFITTINMHATHRPH